MLKQVILQNVFEAKIFCLHRLNLTTKINYKHSAQKIFYSVYVSLFYTKRFVIVAWSFCDFLYLLFEVICLMLDKVSWILYEIQLRYFTLFCISSYLSDTNMIVRLSFFGSSQLHIHCNVENTFHKRILVLKIMFSISTRKVLQRNSYKDLNTHDHSNPPELSLFHECMDLHSKLNQCVIVRRIVGPKGGCM